MLKWTRFVPLALAALLVACAGIEQEPTIPQAVEQPIVTAAAESAAATELPQVTVTERPTPEPTATPEPTEQPGTIHFQNATCHESDSYAKFVIEADEIELLDQFLDLKELDLTGSTCYAQMLAYAAEHPDVILHYTVDLDGVPAANDAESASVKTLSDPSLLAFLPNLKALTVTDPLSPADAAELLAAIPNGTLQYTLQFAGMTVASDASYLDLSDKDPAMLDELKSGIAALPNLTRVNLKGSGGKSAWTLEQAASLQSAKAGLLVDYTVNAFGKTFSLADEIVDLSGVSMKKRLNELKETLPYLAGIAELDLINCGLTNDQLAELRAAYPTPKIVWKIKCGAYECRTDAVMIKFAGKSQKLQDKDVKALQYCNETRYLDLGHNSLHHMDFVKYMPDLEVLIMLNPVIDINSIGSCPKLEYFECFSGMLKDLTPLAACTELKHINLCFNNITDITPLYGLTKLERVWISRNKIPQEQIEHLRELVPNCKINTTTHNPTSEGWRVDPRYDLLREQFQYDNTHMRSYNLRELAEMPFYIAMQQANAESAREP